MQLIEPQALVEEIFHDSCNSKGVDYRTLFSGQLEQLQVLQDQIILVVIGILHMINKVL